MRTGFDNDKYLKIQSEHIKERIGNFDVYGKYGSVGAYNGNLGYLNTGAVGSCRKESGRC